MARSIYPSVELGHLLAQTIGAVVQAQESMDNYTLQRKQAYEQAEQGELSLPPLWYLFNRVDIEMELSASVGSPPQSGSEEPHLMCRTLEPAMVSLYGHQAAAGLRVRVQMTPQGVVPIKHGIPEDQSPSPQLEEE